MQSVIQRFLTALIKLRMEVAKAVSRIPYWNEIVHYASWVCTPVVWFAHATLRAFPGLRRMEWLLEIESLTKIHPVLLALSMLYVVWRGLHTTHLGHIGTDLVIYPLLGLISGFNPFLGLTCGILFGIADLVQKLIVPDIYGAAGWGDLNYWGAMAGYIIGYSSLMLMGVFPGMLSRIFRLGARVALQKLLFHRAAASADGGEPPDRYGFNKYFDPATKTFKLNFKDPKVLEVVHGLSKDSRNLLADPDGWRQQKLTPEQRLVLAQMRGQGMLGPKGQSKLQSIIDQAAEQEAKRQSQQEGEGTEERWLGRPTLTPSSS